MITRFAPSPTGLLHLGHAYAAKVAAHLADEADGRFLIRIEDIDHTRSRPEFETAIFEDLAWLGFSWEEPVMRQSDQKRHYQSALDKLIAKELVYPCFCTRKEIEAEVAAMPSAPHDPMGVHYPGTCRQLSEQRISEKITQGREPAWRLNMSKAAESLGNLTAIDRKHGTIKVVPTELDDIVLARRDIGTSYHLAVVIDDAEQGISLVTRGEDLLSATPYHRVLQALLDLPVPEWFHHALITDEQGKRLATRDQAHSLRLYRENGLSAADVLAMLPEPT